MSCTNVEVTNVNTAIPSPTPINPVPEALDPQNASGAGAALDNQFLESGIGGTQVFPPDNQPVEFTGSPPTPSGTSGGESSPPDSTYADNIDSDPTLGSLSSRYESNGDPTVIGRDSTGGYSYGEYQIATLTGTFGNYMDYLQVNDPALYNELQAAGGESAATAGDPAFKNVWKTAMQDPAKAKTQHDFIQASHFNPAANKIKGSTGLDVTTRSKVLQDAVWSTAVQHGPGGANTIVQRAMNRAGRTSDTITDEELIVAIYDERAQDNGRKYFRRSTPGVRASVVNRFGNEKADALAALG